MGPLRLSICNLYKTFTRKGHLVGDLYNVETSCSGERSYFAQWSEDWIFYAIPTARVILTAETSLDVFSLRREQVITFSVLVALWMFVGPP